MQRRLPKYSVTVAGHATSISLEPEFWQALQAIATQQKKSLPALLAMLDQKRLAKKPASSLASAARVFVLQTLQIAGQDKKGQP